jgi:NAD-dependent dihydropyrimidine dehydrogenase PreA subunit
MNLARRRLIMPTIVDSEKCDGCESCVDACPMECITMVDDIAHIDPEECIDCEACIEACPNEAISMVDEEGLATG